MWWLTTFGYRGGDPRNFSGKFVVIHPTLGRGGGVFEGVKLIRIGFSHFVVGQKVAPEFWSDRYASNITTWFGINDIGQMQLYDDLEAARRAYDPDGF